MRNLGRRVSATGVLVLCLATSLVNGRGAVCQPADADAQELGQRKNYEQAAAAYRQAAAQHRAVGCSGLAACEMRMAAYHDCLAASLGPNPPSSCGEASMQGCPQCDMGQKGAAASPAAGGTSPMNRYTPSGSAPIAPGALVSPDAVPHEFGATGPVRPRVERRIDMDPGLPDSPIAAPAPARDLLDLAPPDSATREAKYGAADPLGPLPKDLVEKALDDIGRALDDVGAPGAGDPRTVTGPVREAAPPSVPAPIVADRGAQQTNTPSGSAGDSMPTSAGLGWGAPSRFGDLLRPNEPPGTTMAYGADGAGAHAGGDDRAKTDKDTDLLSDPWSIPKNALASPASTLKKLGGALSYKAGETLGNLLLDPDARERVSQREDANENILEQGTADRLFDKFVRAANYPVYLVKKFNEGLLNPALKSIYSALDEFGRPLGER